MFPYAFLSFCNSLLPVVADVNDADDDDVAAATTNVVASSGRPVMTCKHFP